MVRSGFKSYPSFCFLITYFCNIVKQNNKLQPVFNAEIKDKGNEGNEKEGKKDVIHGGNKKLSLADY